MEQLWVSLPGCLRLLRHDLTHCHNAVALPQLLSFLRRLAFVGHTLSLFQMLDLSLLPLVLLSNALIVDLHLVQHINKSLLLLQNLGLIILHLSLLIEFILAMGHILDHLIDIDLDLDNPAWSISDESHHEIFDQND